MIKDDARLILSEAPEVLGDGTVTAGWAEGPAWVREEGILLFSDIHGNRILQWSEETNKITVWQENCEYTNGRTTGLNGEIIQCSHGRRSVEMVHDGVTSEIVGEWQGRRFNSPNDVVVKSDGTIWFSDPSYGIRRPGEGYEGELEYGDHWVFRFDPVAQKIDPVILDVEMPNGLAFSPDESLLYSSDNSIDLPNNDPNPNGTHSIRVYKVLEGRLLKGGRDFVLVNSGIADGIRVDELGNVWSCEFDGIHIYTPEARLIGFVPTPEGHIGNMCFGGGGVMVRMSSCWPATSRIACGPG
ncbi:SMP-30/gluconolactonase/LRE family protein [Propionibacterium australiense]|uniref:SMP-30/gluconolactonase/LRE family protein n=1 Tax=Propionibacterium australiense TaxID=119981 RepID=UPI000EF1B7AE|nr:SMP-30/gluconolactonase/LRE family protein [Propionibacterium australiense]RLP08956.1 SMP-30/gluconolactonase/LRE family protein [Propionibacterium australiense]